MIYEPILLILFHFKIRYIIFFNVINCLNKYYGLKFLIINWDNNMVLQWWLFLKLQNKKMSEFEYLR